jgi:REP element-mobilizing transposase RayT
LRPEPKVNQIIRFCMAYAAGQFGIRIHCYCVMSNHFHLVLTDVHGNLPRFMHWVDEYVAKCINARLGRWEALWAQGSYSAVRLVDLDDIVAKMVYVYTNPVSAGLVVTARDWPGARSLPGDLAKPAQKIERPAGYFRASGSVPEFAELELHIPHELESTEGGPVALLQAAVRHREKEIQRNRGDKRQGFLGVRRVLEQSPFGHPVSRDPRRNLNPRIAARDKWRRIEALARLKQFVTAYRKALHRFLQGDRSVLFPDGTYWMRVRFGVLCAGP